MIHQTCTIHMGLIAKFIPGLQRVAVLKMSSQSNISKSPTSPKSSNVPPSPTDSQSSLNFNRNRLIQNYLNEHVQQWKDDTLIQSLFANLPNREAKPEAFKQKYSFWKDLLISMTRERLLSGSVFKFHSKNLSSSFKRGGLQPICLNGVIHEMQTEGLIMDASIVNFSDSKRSSLLGGVVKWIYGSFKTMLIGDSDDGISDDSFAENDESSDKIPSHILLPSLLNEQAKILGDFLRNDSHLPFTFEEFHELVNESRRREGLVEIVEKDDILLILKYLSSEGLLNYSPMVEKITDNTLLAIKIKGPVTKVDFDIVKLKRLHSKLSIQVNELSVKISEIHYLARKSVQVSNDRKMAIYHLKRKALLEKIQGDRLNSLHAVDEILLRISSVSDDAMILEAYKSGASALKGLLPNVKDVDEAVDQLQSLLSEHDEISQALNQNNNISAEFDEELEAELMNLAGETSKPSKSPLSAPEADVETIISEFTQVKLQEPEESKEPKENKKTPELA